MEENTEVVQEVAGEEVTTPPVEEVAEVVEPKVEPEKVEKVVPLAALEDERRKRQDAEARLAEREVKPAAPAKTMEEYYEADPQATIAYINNEIAKLQNDDPFGSALQVEQLRDLKIELKEKVSSKTMKRQNEYAAKITAAIPDFLEVKPALEKFATENLGYSYEDLGRMTDPRVVGENALNTMKLIKRQFDMVSGRTPVKRESQAPEPLPNKLGGGHSPAEPDPANMSIEQWMAWDKQRTLDKLKARTG
jgi:hypothetical protein